MSSVCHVVFDRVRGVGVGVRGGWSHAWTTTLTCRLYMVVLQIHRECVQDLFSTKSHSLFLFFLLFFFKPRRFIFTTKEKKRKNKHPSPLTTSKVYKVETPCCWEMRIEKEEKRL